MATGDILFLLLFIVLPTAVIVSGIWAIVFVRMRPPAARVAAHEDAQFAAEPIALAAPAAETTLSLAAVAIDDASGNAAEYGYADAVAPVLTGAEAPALSSPVAPALSEREAIASIDPLAADLLFDQPVPPPPEPEPFTDRAPTEEMPSFASGTTGLEAISPDQTVDEAPAETDALAADVEVLQIDEPDNAEGVAAKAVPEPDGPPADLHLGGGTDDLDAEQAGVEEFADDATEDQASAAAPDDGSAVTEPDQTATVGNDISQVANRAVNCPDEDAPFDADAEALGDQEVRRRGPLRLIPSDEHDPRDRRRTRNAGRRAPQLPRSIRRNERGV